MNPTPGYRSKIKVYRPIAIDAPKGRVAIKDHAGETLEWVPIARARALIAAGAVEILGTRRRIRALRFRQAEPLMEQRHFVVRKAGFGAPHRRETYENPRGCWHLEFLRDHTRELFTQVADDCTVNLRTTFSKTMGRRRLPSA